jgi:hypothetical protein
VTHPLWTAGGMPFPASRTADGPGGVSERSGSARTEPDLAAGVGVTIVGATWLLDQVGAVDTTLP